MTRLYCTQGIPADKMQAPLLWFHLTLTVATDSTSQYCTRQHCVSHFVHYRLRTLTRSCCTEKYHSRGWWDTPQRLTSPCPCSPHSVFVTMMNTSAAASSATAAAAASTMPAATSGPLVRPSRCTITQGTTHCTCEPGYTISGRDSNTCTGICHRHTHTHTYKAMLLLRMLLYLCVLFPSDIDECELFHNGQAGRLCLHACVNTPGGYRCSCPAGYNVTRDGRSCKGVFLSLVAII